MDESLEGILISEIVIRQVLDEHGEPLVSFDASDGHGGELSLVEILGLLELSKNTAILESMNEGDDYDE